MKWIVKSSDSSISDTVWECKKHTLVSIGGNTIVVLSETITNAQLMIMKWKMWWWKWQILSIGRNRFCNIAIKAIRQNCTISQHYAQDWKSQVSCDGKSFRYLHEIIIPYHIMIKWPNTKCDCTVNVMETLTCQGSLIWCGLPNYIFPAIPITCKLGLHCHAQIWKTSINNCACPDTVGPEVWACSQAGVDSTMMMTHVIPACFDSLPQSFLF